MIERKVKINLILVSAIILSYIFQNALEIRYNFFKYFDELTALVGLCWCIYYFSFNKISKKILFVGICLITFVFFGVISNIIFEYQNWKWVIVDVFTNVKFFGNMGLGFMVANYVRFDKFYITAEKTAKIATLILFSCTILDIFFNCFPSQTGERFNLINMVYKTVYIQYQYLYKTKKLTLFYFHGTYLAAAIVFLLMLFTLKKEFVKKNRLYIFMCIVMLGLTGRSKAIAIALVYLFMYVYCNKMKKTINMKKMFGIGIVAGAIGWSKIKYFYFTLGDSSARSVLSRMALRIASDYFPLGTGFGTYASDQAAKHYSIVYNIYGMNVGETAENSAFLNDVMWPIVLGQGGFLGMLFYIIVIVELVICCLEMQKDNNQKYINGQWATLFGMFYLLISSLGEPTFNNSISAAIAFTIGLMIWWNYGKPYEKTVRCNAQGLITDEE